jgi:hypothetical protein
VAYPDENPDELVRAAIAQFETTARADVNVIRGWCLEAYRELYRRMIEIGDYPGALRAVKELLKYADHHRNPEPDAECAPPVDVITPAMEPKPQPRKRRTKNKT